MEVLIEKQIVEIDFKKGEGVKDKKKILEILLKEEKDPIVIGVIKKEEGKWEREIFSIGDAIVYELFGIPLMVLKRDVGWEELKEAIAFFNFHLKDKGEGIILIIPNFNLALRPEIYYKVIEKEGEEIYIYPSRIKREVTISLKDVV
jgi:hypothetical protein